MCEAVDAPQPARIDVDCEGDASVGYRRGIFSMLGHFIAELLLRQMEYHADQHEARLVGSPTFVATSRLRPGYSSLIVTFSILSPA